MITLIYLYLLLSLLVAIMAMIRGRPGTRWFIISLFLSPLITGLLVMALPPLRPEFPPLADEDELPWEESPAKHGDSTIRILRRSGYADRNSPYEILVNGTHIGAVARDSVVDFRVPHGPLVLEARGKRGGSGPLLIEAVPHNRVDIEISKRRGPLRALWDATFGAESYLSLRKVSPTGV
jgi:hypothetical protein